MKSECPSVYKPELVPGLEIQCGLPAGHRGFHQGMGYSWPAENSPLALNPNRPLNPSEVRSWIDMAGTLVGFLGFVFILIGGIALLLPMPLIGLGFIVIGFLFCLASYKLWSRSLRI